MTSSNILFQFSLCRNVIYNLSIFDLTENHKILWRSSEDDINMCLVKGKDEVSFMVWVAYLYTTLAGRNTKHEQKHETFIIKFWAMYNGCNTCPYLSLFISLALLMEFLKIEVHPQQRRYALQILFSLLAFRQGKRWHLLVSHSI